MDNTKVIKGTPIKQPSNKMVVKGRTISKPDESKAQDKPTKAINDLTASARKATIQVSNKAKQSRNNIAKSASRGIAKAKDHSSIQAKRAGDAALRSVSNAVRELENTSKAISSQTIGLFKHASENITIVAKGSVNAAKETLSTMVSRVGEDISINKENAIAASMYRINPLIGYFASRMASPAVLGKLKETGRKAFEGVKNARQAHKSTSFSENVDSDNSIGSGIDEIGDVSSGVASADVVAQTKRQNKASSTSIAQAKKQNKLTTLISNEKSNDSSSSIQNATINKTIQKPRRGLSSSISISKNVSNISKFTDNQLLQNISISAGKVVGLLSRLPKMIAANDSNAISIMQKDQAGNNIVSKGSPTDLGKLNKINTQTFKTSWTPNLRSFFKDFARSSSISSLGVNEEMQFKSQFDTGDSSKGLLSKFISAYKVATDTYDLSYKDKMLRATLEMKSALAAERKIWPVIRDRMILESATLRSALVAFNAMKIPFTLPLKMFRWGTKERGGYISKLPKGIGGIEHTAAVLDMIYADGMWRLDNIVFQLKRIYQIQSEAITGKSDIVDLDIDSKRWTIFGKLFGHTSSQQLEKEKRDKDISFSMQQDIKTFSKLTKKALKTTHGNSTLDDPDDRSNKMAFKAYRKYKDNKLEKLRNVVIFEKEKTLMRLAKLKFKEEKRKKIGQLKYEKLRLANLIAEERIKRRINKIQKFQELFTIAKWKQIGKNIKQDAGSALDYIPGVNIKRREDISKWAGDISKWAGDKYTKVKEATKKKLKGPADFAKAQLKELRLIHRANKAALLIGIRKFKLGRAALNLQKKAARKMKGFTKSIWTFIMLIPSFLKNLVGKFTSKLFPLLRPLLGLSKGALLGGAGLAMGAVDAFRGGAKAKKWGTTTTAGAIGGFLGGAGDDSFTAGGAIKGAAKGASFGAMIGSVVPGVGTAIGGAIGAVAGGILGFIGGKKIAKVLDYAIKPIKAIAKAIWKIISFPFTLMFGVFKAIKKVFTTIKEKGFTGAISELGSWVFNSIKDLMKAMVTKPLNWIKGWFGGDKKPETEKTNATKVKNAKAEKKNGFHLPAGLPGDFTSAAAATVTASVTPFVRAGIKKANILRNDADAYLNKNHPKEWAATKTGYNISKERMKSVYAGAKETIEDKIQRVESVMIAGGSSEAGHTDILTLLRDVTGQKTTLKKKLLKYYTNSKEKISEKWQRIKIALLAGESEAGNIDLDGKLAAAKIQGKFKQTSSKVQNSYSDWHGRLQSSLSAGAGEAGNIDLNGKLASVKKTINPLLEKDTRSRLIKHEAQKIREKFKQTANEAQNSYSDWHGRLQSSLSAGASEAGSNDIQSYITEKHNALKHKAQNSYSDWHGRLQASLLAGASEAGADDVQSYITEKHNALKHKAQNSYSDWHGRLQSSLLAGAGEAGNNDIQSYITEKRDVLKRGIKAGRGALHRGIKEGQTLINAGKKIASRNIQTPQSVFSQPITKTDDIIGSFGSLSKLKKAEYYAKSKFLSNVPIDKLVKSLPKSDAEFYLTKLKSNPSDENRIRAEVLSHIDKLAEKQIGPLVDSTYIASTYAKQKTTELKNSAFEYAEAASVDLKNLGRDTRESVNSLSNSVASAVNSVTSNNTNNSNSSVVTNNSSDDTKKSCFDPYIDSIINCTVL